MLTENTKMEFIVSKAEGMKPVAMVISNRCEMGFHLAHMKMEMPSNGEISFSYDMIPDVIAALQKIYEKERPNEEEQ